MLNKPTIEFELVESEFTVILVLLRDALLVSKSLGYPDWTAEIGLIATEFCKGTFEEFDCEITMLYWSTLGLSN